MRLGEDVGIDAQREARLLPQPGGARGEQLQLRRALHVELQDARCQCKVNLRSRLAHAGEDHPAYGLRRGGQHTLQFATGDNINPRSALGEQLDDGQRRIDLDRVADQVIAAGERLLKKREPFQNLVGGVNVERRAVELGQHFQRNFAAVQGTRRLRVIKRTR